MNPDEPDFSILREINKIHRHIDQLNKVKSTVGKIGCKK